MQLRVELRSTALTQEDVSYLVLSSVTCNFSSETKGEKNSLVKPKGGETYDALARRPSHLQRSIRSMKTNF